MRAGITKSSFIEFLLSSNEEYLAQEPFFKGKFHSIEPIILELFEQISQIDPLIIFNALYFINRNISKITEPILEKIFYLLRVEIENSLFFAMAKLKEQEKKLLGEAFRCYVSEIIVKNSEEIPIIQIKMAEFSRSEYAALPKEFIFTRQTKWNSLSKILELQLNYSKTNNMNMDNFIEKTPIFSNRKEENIRLKDENEKLKQIILSLENKISSNKSELNIQEDFDSDIDPKLKDLSLKELENLSNEKDSLIEQLTKLNEDYQAYNQHLLALKGEQTQINNSLLFQYSNIKDPKEEIKAQIQQLKDDNKVLKQKLFDLYGIVYDKPTTPHLNKLPINKRPRMYDSQLINMTRNSFEISPNKIFDPIRNLKVESLKSSNIEAILQSKRNGRSSAVGNYQESYIKGDNEIFDSNKMNESVKLEQKDKPFFMKKTNKKEEFWDLSHKTKENGQGFKINLSNIVNQFKDLEEFSGERLNQVKKTCLLNKGLLYSDEEVQFGFISTAFYHQKEVLLKIMVYFGNIKENDLEEFEVKFIGNSTITLWTKPRDNKTNILPAKTQEKQELIIKFHEIPFNLLFQKCSFKSKSKIKRLILVIPCTLNKFLLEISTEMKEFKAKWKSLKKESYCYSEFFEPNPFLLKGPSNIKQYFQYLINLNPHKEYDFIARKGKLVMAGSFFLETQENPILLKFLFHGQGTMGFKAVSKGKTFKACEFLLQTLCYLFKK